jgi:predicted dehydrogenase
MNDSKNPTPLRAAIVGLGKMGLVHASTIKTHPDVELVAFCDTSKFMTSALGNFFPGIKFYSDYKEMLAKESLNVVYITTPTGSHATIANDCAAAGKHVFVEKPLATDYREAEQVDQNAKKHGIKTQVGYVCRYAPTFEKARDIIKSGALGRIFNFGSVKYSSDVVKKVENSWRFMRKASEGGGGVVNEFACHGIDLLVWIFGAPNKVRARTESWYSAEVEDYVHAGFDYGSFSGWIESCWSMQDYRKPYNRIDVTGDNGKLTVTDSEIRWLINKTHAGHEAGWHSTNITELYEPVNIFVGDIMFSRQADAFLASIRGGEPARSVTSEALLTQKVLEAIKASA